VTIQAVSPMMYQVLASVNRKFTVFGNVTPCSLVSIDKLLPSTLKVEAECHRNSDNYLPKYTASHSIRSMFCII